MSKEYLEALEIECGELVEMDLLFLDRNGENQEKWHNSEAFKKAVEFEKKYGKSHTYILKQALQRLEVIDQSSPSEALGCLKRVWNDINTQNHFRQDFKDLTIIENYILKSQEQEELLKSGDLSDGYHTFNQLYYQRCILFASLVRLNKDKSWKSFKHSDGKYCFDSNGEWFIVGIDTPIGSYTYHYEKKYWDLFECQELECGKEWDGHTEEDITRLLSLPNEQEKVLKIIKEKRVNVYTEILLCDDYEEYLDLEEVKIISDCWKLTQEEFNTLKRYFG